MGSLPSLIFLLSTNKRIVFRRARTRFSGEKILLVIL